MRRALPYLLSGLILLTPTFVLGVENKGLVPCDGPNCETCHVVTLAQNVINFLVGISAFIAVVLFAWAGFLMLTAAGNTGQIEKGKGMFWNVIIGIVIVLAGWLIIDTVMKYTFLSREGGGNGFGPWNEIICVPQPTFAEIRNPGNPDSGRPTVGGATDGVIPSNSANTAGKYQNTLQYKERLCEIAQQHGVGSQCDHLQALMMAESSGNPNATSRVGALGLMQVMPSTACQLDSSLCNLSSTELAQRLKDPETSMRLGVLYYARDYQHYGGDLTKITAAYNGGRGANNPSVDCPGQMRWQCVWDSPGCYGTARTDCRRNEGYEETRNYVTNVNNFNAYIQSRK